MTLCRKKVKNKITPEKEREGESKWDLFKELLEN